MSENIKLANCGNYIAQKIKTNEYIVCLCRILTVGNYTDMNGTPVEVTEDTLVKLVDNYNSNLEEQYKKYILDIQENEGILDSSVVTDALAINIDNFDGLPNQIDHNINTVMATVGNIVGKVFLKQSQGKLSICCYIRVKGADNVACVMDNRWRNLSLGYNMRTYIMAEVSWVVYGADPDANKIMSKSYINNYNNLKNNLHNSKIYDTMQEGLTKIKQLQREIFLEKRLIVMCKLKKITKADTYFLKQELSEVDNLSILNRVFNVLDNLIEVPQKSRFLQFKGEHVQQLITSLEAGANHVTYARKDPHTGGS